MSRIKTTSEAWRRLGERITVEQNQRAGEILAGRPKTLEAYREQVGYLSALSFVIDTMNQLAGEET